jgi:hypothetical protein
MVVTLAGVELEPLESSADVERHRFEYDQNTTVASMAVVAALSEVSGTDPLTLTPLQATLETDALDAIVSGRDDGTADIEITFHVATYAVTVSSDGVVDITASAIQRLDDQNGEVCQT